MQRKTGVYVSLIILFTTYVLHAQDGKIVSKELLNLSSSVHHKIDSLDPGFSKILETVNLYRIVYLSDGLKVIGFMAAPKQKGKFPCIIANRGGRWDFSLWKPFSLAYYLGRMASWGYVVVASQYRGSIDGGEGKDEYGGKDINDVFNLIPVLASIPAADTSRVGIYGESRGGMMTYLALKQSCTFKAAVVVAGVADAFDVIKKRPEIEDVTYRNLIPNYSQNKDEALTQRSALLWPEKLCITTPLLIMHGSADTRVDAAQSMTLVRKLYEHKHPVRFILFEGAEHLLTEVESEMLSQCKKHFDLYVRDLNPLPKL